MSENIIALAWRKSKIKQTLTWPLPTDTVQAITSGGTLAAADWVRIREELLSEVQAAPRVDGVYVSLHVAMAALTEVDLEGHLLSEIRNIIVGKETPSSSPWISTTF